MEKEILRENIALQSVIPLGACIGLVMGFFMYYWCCYRFTNLLFNTAMIVAVIIFIASTVGLVIIKDKQTRKSCIQGLFLSIATIVIILIVSSLSVIY